MTPQEKLKDIESLSVPIGYETNDEFKAKHKDWLVERVKKLEAALEFIANDLKSIHMVRARKALEEEE